MRSRRWNNRFVTLALKRGGMLHKKKLTYDRRFESGCYITKEEGAKMKIGNFNGELTPTEHCSSLKITIEADNDFSKYEITDNGNGELGVRKVSGKDFSLIVKPKSDNGIVVI